VLTVVQEIVLARSGDAHRMDFGGVSSFAAWGAICINQAAHGHWVAYMKTIAHESAHLLLFAIARNEPLVLNDLAERHGSPLRDDARPLDGIFHAAFVSAREALALDACLTRHEAQSASDASAVDLLEQALEDSVFAFWDCCDQLESHARLSDLGEAILKDCQRFMEEAFEIRSGV
jgi:HEXXH motif-containing protein